MERAEGKGRALPRRLRPALAAGAAALLLLLFRRAVGQILFQCLLALLLAWAARPLCARLERRFPQGIAALLALLCFALSLGAFLWVFVPQLVSQLGLVAGAVPQLIELARQALERLQQTAFFRRWPLLPESPDALIQQAGEALLRAVPTALQRVAAFTSRLMRAFLSPVLAYYLLRDRETFCFEASLFVPLRHRRKALTALKEMRREIAGYFRGQLLVSAAVAALTALGLLAVGVPAWLLLGLVMGVCDLIPYVGPYIGALPVALFSLPQGIPTTLWAMGVVIAVQQAEGIFLSPRLMGGATGLHPAAVLLLLSLGGLIGGLGGMLLSLPLFVCARGALRALRCAAGEAD